MPWLFLMACALALVGCSNDGSGGGAGHPALTRTRVGPEGGTATSADGKLTLTFPPGALSQETEITIAPATVEGGVGYELGPDGLQLNTPATATFSAPASEVLPAGVLGTPMFPVFVESNGALESPQNLRIERDQDVIRVTADLTHFSVVRFGFRDLLFDVEGGSTTTVEATPPIFATHYRSPVGGTFGDVLEVKILKLGATDSINLTRGTVSVEPFIILASPTTILDRSRRLDLTSPDTVMLTSFFPPSSFICHAVGKSKYAIKYTVGYEARREGRPGQPDVVTTGELVAFVSAECFLLPLPPAPPPPVTAPPATRTLSIGKDGDGNGTVASTPGGINCGEDCSEAYPIGTGVVLGHIAGADSIFAGWSGNPDCSDGVVTMDADKGCSATFILRGPNTPLLSVMKTGGGTGTVVTTSPTPTALLAIDCGVICSAVYPSGTTVTLSAIPGPGSVFAGWGGGCGGTGLCIVTLTANTTVTATFNLAAVAETACLTGTARNPGSVTAAPLDQPTGQIGPFNPVMPLQQSSQLAKGPEDTVVALSPQVFSLDAPLSPKLTLFSQHPITCALTVLDSKILSNGFWNMAGAGNTLFIGSSFGSSIGEIRRYRIDPVTGLTEVPESRFSTGGKSVQTLAVHRNETYLTATVGGNVLGFRIDPTTLTKTFDMPLTESGAGIFHLSLNPEGNRLYAAAGSSPTHLVTAPLDPNTGTINTAALQSVALNGFTPALGVMRLTTGSDLVFSVERNSTNPALNKLRVDRFNPETNSFAPTPDLLTIDGIRDLSLSPTGLDFLYFAYIFAGGDIGLGMVNLDTGAVTPGIQTRPSPFNAEVHDAIIKDF